MTLSLSRISALVLGAALVMSGVARPRAQAPARQRQPASPAATTPETEYLLQRGDVIQVRLFYNPDLNELLPIRPDGNISLSLVGEVEAAGLTPGELSQRLRDRYAMSLKEPETVVIVKEFANQRVYVGGEVNQPGIIALAGRLSALQGILQAGGFKIGAKVTQVVILRDQGTPDPLFMTVNLKDNLSAKGAADDLLLRAGDIVFVPKTRVTKVGEFVSRNIRDLAPLPLSLGVSYILGNAFIK